jgi:AraC-like DNA-binding protein
MATITLDWFHFLMLLAAVQGLILSGVLAVRQRNRTANRILAVAMLSFTVYLATSVYHAAHLEPVFPHFFGLAHPTPLLFGPLIYLYAVTASDHSRRFTRMDWLHFVPAALAVVGALPVYLLSGPAKLAWYEHAVQTGDVGWTVLVFTPLKLLSGITYTVVTLLFLRRHRARIKDNYSSLERVNLQWLWWLATAAAVVWVVAVVVNFIQWPEGPTSQRGEDFIALGTALVIYGIGFMALRQPEIFRFDTAEHTAVAPEPRYERSGLNEREADALKSALLSTMEREQPWKNKELTLADLAERLSTTPHKLSEVLNSQLEQTFYDFVNGYRVRYVQNRIGDEAVKHLKILALALDAGFASKSTFNDVFKKHTGRTPSDYRRSVAV